MKNLLYKEINLCLNPLNYFFLGFAAMLLIPHYPVYIGFFYMCLSVFWIFNNSLINKDSLFNILLPISKNNIVKARCLLVALYEIVFILLSIPFAFLHNKFFPDGNPTGINANIAFFGLLLIVISAFNLYLSMVSPYLPVKYSSIAFAAVLPAPMAEITVAAPVTASPPA